jgi:O-antigen/teichoic acid export membrane protein
MSEARKNLGLGALALVPIVCCIGSPLIAAAGICVAVAAWAGGSAVGAVVLAAVAILLGVCVRRRRSRQVPRLSMMRSRP